MLDGMYVKSTINGKQEAISSTTSFTMDTISCNLLRQDGQWLSDLLDAKQNVINNGDLTIAKTSGLQDALDAKQETIGTSSDIALNSIVIKPSYTKEDYTLAEDGQLICDSLIKTRGGRFRRYVKF